MSHQSDREKVREWLEEVRKTDPSEIERLYEWFRQQMKELETKEGVVNEFRVKVNSKRKRRETNTNV